MDFLYQAGEDPRKFRHKALAAVSLIAVSILRGYAGDRRTVYVIILRFSKNSGRLPLAGGELTIAGLLSDGILDLVST